MNSEKAKTRHDALRRWRDKYQQELNLVNSVNFPETYFQELLNERKCVLQERIEKYEEKLNGIY